MRATLLMLLLACGDRDTAHADTTTTADTAPADPPGAGDGCATWVLCCEHRCETAAEYAEWAAEPWDCDVECDTGSPGAPPGEACALQADGTCAWE